MNQQLKFTNKILYYALMLSRLIFAYILYAIIAPGSQPSEDQTLVYVIMGIAFTIYGLTALICYFPGGYIADRFDP